jgi:hypothetical protein
LLLGLGTSVSWFTDNQDLGPHIMHVFAFGNIHLPAKSHLPEARKHLPELPFLDVIRNMAIPTPVFLHRHIDM